jgi:hypothetical protein
MYAEYGARVQITEDGRYPTTTRGTIVNDPVAGLAIVQLDGMNGCDVFACERMTVTQTPSESAYSLTKRWSVDECLERIGWIVAIDGRNTARDRYTAALIFELYRLQTYADALLYAPHVDPDKYSHEEDWGLIDEYDADLDDWPQDQGETTRYGYDH